MTRLLDEYEFSRSPDGCGHLHYLVDYDGSPHPEEKLESEFDKCPAISVDLKRDQIIVYARTITPGPPIVHINLRYRKIRQVILEGYQTATIRDEQTALRFLASELPHQFRTNLSDGLGLKCEYISLIEEIEDGCGAQRLIISKKRPSQFDNQSQALVLSERDFHEACRLIDSIRYRSQLRVYNDQRDAVYNHFAPFLARKDKHRMPSGAGATPSLETIFENTDGASKREFADSVSSSAATLIAERPERIKLIKERIDLAFLDTFIQKFDKRLTQKLPEADWQQFFVENPIALSTMFNSAVVMISDRPFVGGTDIEGGGGKKSDFLYQNFLTGNLSFIEIKTPEKDLVSSRDDYSKGMYPAHSDLSLAVSQVIDQRNKFQNEFTSLYFKSPELRLTSSAIRCYVVIGTIPSSDDRKRAFEHVRENFKHVTVVTFDELLSRLKQLRQILATIS